MQPERLEVLEDRTATSRCDQGFLTLRRLRVRHAYPDGTASPPYDCDVVSRRFVDAVAVVLWFRDETGRPQVVLKEGVRPSLWLRSQKGLPGPERHLVIVELVAGMLEDGELSPDGVARRAAAEALEEAGVEVAPGSMRGLGAGLHPTPGVSDERVEFVEAELQGPPARDSGLGDGSGMEHGTRAVVLPLDEALRRCRDGRIPDMKTEIGLGRVATRLGIWPL